MFHKFVKFTLILLILFYPITHYGESGYAKKFFSTKFNEVNVRNGPGKNYYVIGKHLKKGLPILVTGEFDNWKKIVNYLGKEGWIANSQLSKDRYGITNKEIFLRSFPKLESKSLFIIEKNVNFKISSCRRNWCKTDISNLSGWIKKEDFWGVFKEETF